MSSIQNPVTAFKGKTTIASGELADVAGRLKTLLVQDPMASLLVFDDHSGKVIDIDFRGSPEEVSARLQKSAEPLDAPETQPARGPGRPKLGVVAREVTLLPRHWEWLATQSGGASVALRKLVEEASRANRDADIRRQAQEAAYRFMSAMAGDEAGFEEASRALFASQEQDFLRAQQSWPQDISAYVQALAAPCFAGN